MYYPRASYTQKLRAHWERAGPSPLLVIGGARRVGKTTMVLEEAAQMERSAYISRYVQLDELAELNELNDPGGIGEESYRHSAGTVTQAEAANKLQRSWERGRTLADAHTDKTVILILDEIQKAADWSGLVKGLLDEDKRLGRHNLKVTVLGSAPLLLQKGRESLVGRYEYLPLPHWSFGEIRDRFDATLDDFLYYGAYPEVYVNNLWKRADPSDWQEYIARGIIEPYLTRDVTEMALHFRKPALLKTLFEVACAHPAQILSYNALQGQMQEFGNTTTIAQYLDWLSEFGLLAAVEKTGPVVRAKRSSPKLIALNNAFAAAHSVYADAAAALQDRTYKGRLVENAVGAHLWQTLPRGRNCPVQYWRQGNAEVDFVITWNGRPYAIEVKSGAARARGGGMARFLRQHPNAKIIVIGGRDGLDLEGFLSRPAVAWFREWADA